MKSAERVFDLYELFAELQAPQSLSELARKLSMPVSTCFNLVRAFERRGFLYSAGTRRGFYPTKRMLQLVQTIAQSDPMGGVVVERLLKLRDDTAETVVMGKRVGDQILLLEVIESPHRIRYSANVGERRPVQINSMGKALISLLPAAEREELVTKLRFPKLTDRTIRSARDYLADIERSVKRGWFLNDGESVQDVIALAMPVVVNTEAFAITVAGPRYRLEPELEKRARQLRDACRAIQDK